MSDDRERFEPDPADQMYEEDLRALRAEGSKLKPPKPTGHACTSCAPISLPSPTGVPRLWHRHTCKLHPDKPVDMSAYPKGRTWPS